VRVEFRGKERRVVLQHGQAFFEVAHDAARPFIVVADGARVRAIGTKFDVRHDSAAVRVTLLQGRVQVRGGHGSEAELAPGQSVVADQSGVSRPVATNADAVASWTSGRITFSGAPLRDAVAEVNRYSKRKIVLTPADGLAAEPVSGVFEPGDTKTFIAALETVFDLKVAAEDDREIRLARRATPGG
jgi:transmembrane sensor